jgi:hypothetical protein
MHNLGASIKLIGGNVRQSKLRKKPQDLNGEGGGGSSYLIFDTFETIGNIWPRCTTNFCCHVIYVSKATYNILQQNNQQVLQITTTR